MFTFINEEFQEKTLWEFFLNKVYDESWSDFYNRITSDENSKSVDLGATLTKSREMLINFTPDNEVM